MMLDFVTRQEAKRAAAGRARLELLRTTASELAVLLCERFGVTAVYLFGSTARGEPHARMDLDLAVEGLAAARYLEALAAVSDAAPCLVDLVRLEDAADSLRRHIANEGVRLDDSDS